ncbi:MAG: hypothetical protein NUV84_00805 [Candidatus Uhrbacteria bacterium]|nr:hypothetical protein [Candidatus Uhrbacteria bacterium]
MLRPWRKQLGLLTILAVLSVGMVSVVQAASAPNVFTYQGRVLNANGVPVSDTSLSMSFALYTASSGGTCVWSNSSATCASVTARSVTLTTGLFTENLGDTSVSYAAIGDSIFGDNATLYLEVIIAGETLDPRRQVTAAPYALNADTLDGIDSTALQLFEVGTNGTFEDDAATIVGADLAFTYGSGAAGDLRVADELEVMGDGYIDNDLVIGASTSSTETITNTDFSLSGDDLFVAGSLGVESIAYFDGAVSVQGSLSTTDWAGVATNTSLSVQPSFSGTLSAERKDFGNYTLSSSTVDRSGNAYTVSGFTGVGQYTGTAGGPSELNGVYGAGVLSSSSSTAPLVLGLHGEVSSSVVGGTITDARAVYGNVGSSNGSLTTAYGGYFESPAAGSTARYGIYAKATTDDGGNATTLYGADVIAADGAGGNATTAYGLRASASGATTTNISGYFYDARVQIDGNSTPDTPSVATGAGDLFVTGDLEVDGAIDLAGTATVADLACTDCLDFTELSDTMSLDTSTSIALDGTETFTFSNAGTGNGLFIDQNGNGSALVIDSESTSVNVLDIDGSTTTSGQIVQITGGNFTDDTGRAISIDVTESTSTADIILIQTDVGSANNNVFRIEADGEVFSDVGFTAGAFSTNYLDSEIQTSADLLLDIDGGDLTFDQATIIGDGGDAITINSSGTLTVNDTTIAGSGALTLQSAAVGALLLDAASGLVSTATGDDFSVGVDSLVSAFSVDESANLVRVGDGAGTNGEIDLYASDGSQGSLSWTTGEYLAIGGGGMSITNLMSLTDIFLTPAATVLTVGVNPARTLDADGNEYGIHASINSGTDKGANTFHLRGVSGMAVFESGTVAGPTSVAGVYGYGRLNSNSQTSASISGVQGVVDSSTAGGTITQAIGVSGSIATSAGTITRGYGGSFSNTIAGTNRYGIIANASGGSTNFAGYFHGARVQIDGDVTPDTPSVATGTGDLFVTDALEVDGALDVAGASTLGTVSMDLATIVATQFAVCHTNADTDDEPIGDCSGAPTADYAEQYPVQADIEYGDIVVPGTTVVSTNDGETIVQLVKSWQAYQGPVVGIVSNNYGDFTSAGYNISAEDNPMPVALVGRVPVKVTSEGGLISAGDYLTTSSTPGKAMRATKVGRVIGMALEDWDGVSPTLMVQVNNSWSMGDVLGTDGTSTLVTDNVIVSSVDTASAEESSFDSYGLALRGSAWNGSEAQAVEMILQNVVDDQDQYRLSIRNTTETEIAYITNEGTMKIAGDMVIGGRLYPSDRGVTQTEKYIYYDGSAGVGGDFMRTNAKGWSTGSYDFAEMFPSGEELTSGDVVVFAGTGETVQRATGTEGEQLAGIVSTRPGFLAGENVAGAYPIALAGRVPTKVSTSNGSIAVGDPLTASTTAGVAMKASEAGQIIGYALENFTGTESDNLVLAYVNVGYWSSASQTMTLMQNVASETSQNTQAYSGLNMSGNIYMATNSILSIGRLEGMSALWSIETDGTIKTQGSLKTVTESYQGTKVETMAVTSPENMIILTGTATLVEGRAEIRFEEVSPEYNDVISAIAPIRVIVTPSGPVSLYVSEKDQNHFVVERFVGSADVEFDWMVTGYRKGFEPEVEEETIEEEPSDPSVPSVPSDLSALPDEPEPLAEEEPEPAVEEEPAITENLDASLIDPPIESESLVAEIDPFL